MESRTWHLSQDKIQKEIEIRQHFGWKELSKTPYSLVMQRESSSVNRRLKKLEKEYDYLSKKFPFACLVWIAIGVVLLIPSIFLIKMNDFGWLTLMASIACFFVGVSLLLMFLACLPSRKDMIKRIINFADEISGNFKSLPIPINLKKCDKHSYEIKKAVYRKDIQI